MENGLRWGGVKLHPYHSHRGEPVVSMFDVKYSLGPSVPPVSVSPIRNRCKAHCMCSFFCLSFPHVNGEEGGRGESRYATLPQTPPLSDSKVMGLKETFSQHSPHLCDLRARHVLTGTRRPIKHLINYTACMYIRDKVQTERPCALNSFILLFMAAAWTKIYLFKTVRVLNVNDKR